MKFRTVHDHVRHGIVRSKFRGCRRQWHRHLL